MSRQLSLPVSTMSQWWVSRSQFLILPVVPRPYDTLWSLLVHNGRTTAAGTTEPTGPGVQAIAMFSLVLLAECLFAVRVATSPLLDLLLDGRDVRQQGWVYESVVRPRRNGYEPFAYVLTTPTNGAFGLGYRGLVVEIRQAGDGQLKTLSLSEPEVFVYELDPRESKQKSVQRPSDPRMKVHPSRWLGGAVAIEANLIRNVVIHNVKSSALTGVEAALDAAENG